MVEATQERLSTSVEQGGRTPISPSLAVWTRWEIAFLLIVSVWFWTAFFLRQHSVVEFGLRTDFLGVYTGARIVATGHGSQLYDLGMQRSLGDSAISPFHRGRVMAFVYPAYVAVLFRPLGRLSFGPALISWGVVNVLAAFWTIFRVAETFGDRAQARRAIPLICVACIPLQLTLVQGQLGILPTLAVTESLVALRSGKHWRAGWWLSLGLLKPQMILFPLLALAIWGCWRAILPFCAVLCGLLALSFAEVGFWITRYVHFLMEYNQRGGELSLSPLAMQNWRGLACTLLRTNDSPVVRGIVLGMGIASVLAMFVIFSQHERPRFGAPLSFRNAAYYLIAVLLGLMSSPHLYIHDWIMSLPAGFALWPLGLDTATGIFSKRSVLAWLLATAPLVFFVAEFVWPRPILPVYGTLVLALALASLSSPIGSHGAVRAASE